MSGKEREELEQEMRSMAPMMKKYMLYSKAKFLGVTFGPKDLTVEELEFFYTIEDKFKQIKDEAMLAELNGISRTRTRKRIGY